MQCLISNFIPTIVVFLHLRRQHTVFLFHPIYAKPKIPRFIGLCQTTSETLRAGLTNFTDYVTLYFKLQ